MTRPTATLQKASNDISVNPDWAKLPLFDRSKWQRVKFGDVVRVLKEQVDPNSGEVDRYVAGEHMETENVHIRQWGTVGDGYLGPAFIRRFRKGQVLYGSRRTYLKKVAVAEWDGVTSNTTLVLEADEKRLLQRLLPWLMLSERFTKHSVAESKGSTNPYINWPDIAKFEFDLPPLDQQRRVTEILWAADTATLTARNNQIAAENYRTTLLSDALDSLAQTRVKFRNIQELINAGVIEPPQDGNHGELHPTSKDYVEDGIPFIMANDIQNGKINLLTCKRITRTQAGRLRIGFSEPGDVLLTHKGTVGLTALVPTEVGEFIMLTPQVTYYRVVDSSRLRKDFLLAVFNSEQFQQSLKIRAKQSTRDYIGILAQRELAITIPDVIEQDQILENLARVDNLIRSLKSRSTESKALSAALANTLS
jgi:type I restriction enzyme, S subunit